MSTTTKVTHTPGPWDASNSYCRTSGTPGWEVGPIGLTVAEIGPNVPASKQEANARLIAAAPELLQALYDCITQEGSVSRKDADPVKLIRRLNAIDDIARAAIAKAEGGG